MGSIPLKKEKKIVAVMDIIKKVDSEKAESVKETATRIETQPEIINVNFENKEKLESYRELPAQVEELAVA